MISIIMFFSVLKAISLEGALNYHQASQPVPVKITAHVFVLRDDELLCLPDRLSVHACLVLTIVAAVISALNILSIRQFLRSSVRCCIHFTMLYSRVQNDRLCQVRPVCVQALIVRNNRAATLSLLSNRISAEATLIRHSRHNCYH